MDMPSKPPSICAYAERVSLMNSRSVPCDLHFHFAAKDEILEREVLSRNVASPLLKPCAELFGDIIQIPSSIPHRLRY